MQHELDQFLDWLKRHQNFDIANPSHAIGASLKNLVEKNPEDVDVQCAVDSYLTIMAIATMAATAATNPR